MDAGANTGCSSGDCEGEEQEDPSSSYDEEELGARALSPEDSEEQKSHGEEDLFAFRQQWQRELDAAVSPSEEVKLNDDQPDDAEREGTDLAEGGTRPGSRQECSEDELAVFRQQWRRELEATPAPEQAPEQAAPAPPHPPPTAPVHGQESASVLEKAKALFLRGADLERSGKGYEAIQHYKRALTLVPDIERRIYDATKGQETPQEEVVEVKNVAVNTTPHEDSDEEMVEGEEVAARLLRIQARKGILITPQVNPDSTHLSVLPYEVLQVLLRWVVSSELDCVSLEAVGAACRALHIAARDRDLWRAVCLRTWGLECGVPRAHGCLSWRDMYVRRPRLQLHGCYISKTTYLRHGEDSFQDQFYRPWYIIDYYRYLRFFPEGQVLLWTTAEEPAACVRELRGRTARAGSGILAGHYRLIGDKVVIVIKKTNEKKPAAASTTRFRRRKEAEPDAAQTFHLELELRGGRARRNGVLAWCRYRVARRDVWTHFDLTPKAFPPFAFSRVKAYTREATAPL